MTNIKIFTELGQPQHLLERILGSTKDGIAAYDLDGHYIFWNKGMEKLSGKLSNEVLGHICWDVFPFMKETGVDKAIKNAIKGTTSTVNNIGYFFEKTGDKKYFDATYGPLCDRTGAIIGAMGIVRDTTERYRAERALAESELKFRSLTESALDAIIMCDADGKILSWNKGADDIFQYRDSEILGENLSQIIPEAFWKNYLKEVLGGLSRDALAKHGRSSELFGSRKTGSNFPMDITLSAWNSDGHVYFSVLVRDISDRRHLEAIAEEQANLYDALLRAQSDLGEGVTITSVPDGKILYANDSMCKLFGYTREELLALPDAWILAAPEQLELLGQRHQARLERGATRDHVETIGLRKDGSRFHMEFAMVNEETNFGPVVVNIIRDITKGKQAELDLAESQRFMTEIVKNASDVVCTISPDGTLESISPSFETLTGWKVGEWLSKSLFSLIRKEDLSETKEKIAQVLEGRSQVTRAKWVKKDGQFVNIETSLSPLLEEGRIVGILSIGRNMS